MSQTKPFETYRPWKSVNPELNVGRTELTQPYPDDDSILVETGADYPVSSVSETALLIESIASLISVLDTCQNQEANVKKLANFAVELVLGREEETPLPQTEKIEVVEASPDTLNPVI